MGRGENAPTGAHAQGEGDGTYGSVALNGRTAAISSNLDLRLSARLRRISVCFSWDEELR